MLEALHWASLDPTSTDVIRALEDTALKYLEGVAEENDIRAIPYPRVKGPDLVQIAQFVARWTATDAGDHPTAAATIFVIKAREYGIELPGLTGEGDDEKNVQTLAAAIRKSPRKHFETNEKRAYSWTRTMLRCGGRTDADNALKDAEFGWTKKDRTPVKD
ncbi:MAG TPA: hypothetical protein VIY73_15880 [Polyangiaceae bacterium]